MVQRGQRRKPSKKEQTKAHLEYVGLEVIINQMGDAMRSAFLPYVATSGRITPRMYAALEDFIRYAARVA